MPKHPYLSNVNWIQLLISPPHLSISLYIFDCSKVSWFLYLRFSAFEKNPFGISIIGLFPINISSKFFNPSSVFENKLFILFFAKFSFFNWGLNLNRPLGSSSNTKFEVKVKVLKNVKNWIFEIDLRSKYIYCYTKILAPFTCFP